MHSDVVVVLHGQGHAVASCLPRRFPQCLDNARPGRAVCDARPLIAGEDADQRQLRSLASAARAAM